MCAGCVARVAQIRPIMWCPALMVVWMVSTTSDQHIEHATHVVVTGP